MTAHEQPQHEWFVAAWLPVTPRQARFADVRSAITIPGPTRVDATAVVCLRCRRDYADVCREPCVDRTFTQFNLIGGRPGQRTKPRRTTTVEVQP